MKIAVAGASGFVGSHLIERLSKEGHQVIALSRTKRSSQDPNMSWKKCDLFSRLDIISALQGCDAAVYLVHSMLPSARLSQGSFLDYDLVLADNFARAAKQIDLKHLIYVGGIIPEDMTLSPHLLSRLEVERTLKASGLPFTSLRAGIILGPLSSSFRMMHELVLKLPIMICPSWTQTLSSPVFITDIIEALVFCSGNEKTFNKSYDIGGKTTISYLDMMKVLARKLGKKRFFMAFPFFTPGLSKLWVSLITGAPKDLVYPLIGSLKTHMVPNIHRSLDIPGTERKSFEASIDAIVQQDTELKNQPKAFQKKHKQARKEVRSIQRLETLYRFDAKEVARLYFQWLPTLYAPLIKVIEEEGTIRFLLCGMKQPLLTLVYSDEVSTTEHQVYYIKKGFLTEGEGRGRLNFRSIIDLRYTMVEIHEFVPRLPWYIYKFTQAKWHLYVMRSFNRYLLSIQKDA